MDSKRIITVLAHGFAGWALCAASMGIGLAVTTERNALLIHAVGAPVFFSAVSFFYFRRFDYTTPAQTAAVFVSFIILVDFFFVSLLVLGNFAMFGSLLGTWIPFALVFASTYLTGTVIKKKGASPGA